MKRSIIVLLSLVAVLLIAGNVYADNGNILPEPISTTLFLVGGATMIAANKFKK